MTVEEIKAKLKEKEYDFLREDEHLKGRIGMLNLGGSIAYGTNLEGKGDIDLRGFYFEKKEEIIGIVPNSEQVVETETDTVLYSFNKLVNLLISCNPNTIEFLGCKPEHYFKMSEIAQMLLDNRKAFLSKNCVRSFGGYANQQLNRLENAIARDRLTQNKKEEHIKLSMENAMASFKDRYEHFKDGSIKIYTGKSYREGFDTEVLLDVDLEHFSAREFSAIMNELTTITRQYDKLNHRNHKKDEEHLDKHAMHLLRLYYMAFDLMEKKEIVTYRENERDFLLSVRQGKFRKEDGTYTDEFFDIRNEMNKRFEYDVKNTDLPEKPDMKKINEIVMYANEKIVREEI